MLTSSFSLGRTLSRLVVFNCIFFLHMKKFFLHCIMFLIAKRIGFAVSKKKNFSHSVQSAITHSRSFRGYHNASLLPSPQISLTIAPFLGASGGDQSSSLPVGVGSAWGPAPGPYLILWPFLVSWSIPPMSQVGAQLSGESEHQSKRGPEIPSDGTPPHSSQGSFPPARPSHQSGGSRGWHGWNFAEDLQKCCRNQ